MPYLLQAVDGPEEGPRGAVEADDDVEKAFTRVLRPLQQHLQEQIQLCDCSERLCRFINTKNYFPSGRAISLFMLSD